MATEEVYVNAEEIAEWTGPDEHICMNRDSKKSVAAPSAPSENEPHAHRRVVWTVVIGLLSALLLAALIFIVLTMKMWTSERDELRKELQDLKEEHAHLRRLVDMIWCPKKWVKFGHNCYLLSQNPKNWTDSKQECEELGASLVIISSPEEQIFVSNLTSQNVWIGLTDRETEGVWRWVNGDTVNTTHWRRDEPNNMNEEDCGEIAAKHQLWNDIPCSVKQLFICEKFL